MAKLTPSTALTSPTRRCSSPPWIGKCFTSFSTSRTGAVLMARSPAPARLPSRPPCGRVPASISGGGSLRQRSVANVQRGAKAQPTIGARQIRHQAGNFLQPGPRACGVGLDVETRDRPHQAARIGMQRLFEQHLDRRLLDLAAGIHDDDPLGGLGHHAEIVRDQHDGGAGLLLQLEHEIEDLRLDGDVERRRRLVGDQHLRIAAAAPWRSSPAGACRRKAGGDIRRAGAWHRRCAPGRASRRRDRAPRATTRRDGARRSRRSACRPSAPG